MKENTNTIILASLIPELYTEESLKSLQDCFREFGEIVLWSSLPSFGRAIVVYGGYRAKSCVVAAKSALDRTPFYALEIAGVESTDALRVYFGPNTSDSLLDLLKENRKETLEVPNLDRNFLISPPGSPPVWWEQTREEGPNRCTLADDLIAALECLHVEEPENGVATTITSSFSQEGGDVFDNSSNSASVSSQNSGRGSPVFLADQNEDTMASSRNMSSNVTSASDPMIILLAGENSSIHPSTPAVLVSQAEGNESDNNSDDNNSGPGGRPKITLANTPFGIRRSITSVKATVESMQPRSNSYDAYDQNLARTITPTSRPPLEDY